MLGINSVPSPRWNIFRTCQKRVIRQFLLKRPIRKPLRKSSNVLPISCPEWVSCESFEDCTGGTQGYNSAWEGWVVAITLSKQNSLSDNFQDGKPQGSEVFDMDQRNIHRSEKYAGKQILYTAFYGIQR